jgi:ABC-type Mn2+/Zn2+ transport system ATPase subunit
MMCWVWKKFFRVFVLVMHLKNCQYATIEEIFCINLQMCRSKLPKEMCKNHNLAKKYGKGQQEWEKTCVNSKFSPRKLNNPVKTRQFIIF